MTTYSKEYYIQLLMDKHNMTYQQAYECSTNFFGLITGTLISGKGVKLRHFGTFYLQNKSPRPGWNFQTKESFEVPERLCVKFKMTEE